MHASAYPACMSPSETPILQLVSQKGAMLVPLTHVEVGLYYNKSHTLKHLANARFATLSSISVLLKLHKKKKRSKVPPREWTLITGEQHCQRSPAFKGALIMTSYKKCIPLLHDQVQCFAAMGTFTRCPRICVTFQIWIKTCTLYFLKFWWHTNITIFASVTMNH